MGEVTDTLINEMERILSHCIHTSNRRFIQFKHLTISLVNYSSLELKKIHQTTKRSYLWAGVLRGEDRSEKAADFYYVPFTSVRFVITCICGFGKRNLTKPKRPFSSLIPFPGSHDFGCITPEDAAADLPVSDLFQQRGVFVVSELASSWTRNVHDVGVRGHQDNSEWVLQLAAKG